MNTATSFTSVLAATCGAKRYHGVLAVGDGSVLKTGVPAAMCGTVLRVQLILRASYTGTGLGDPRHEGVVGVRSRPGGDWHRQLMHGCSWPDRRPCASNRQDHNHRNHHNHHNHHTGVLVHKVAHQWRPWFYAQRQTLVVDIVKDVKRVTGAAQRRRERHLRARQRHVRTAVQLPLAEKLHHSACRAHLLEKEWMEQGAGELRGLRPPSPSGEHSSLAPPQLAPWKRRKGRRKSGGRERRSGRKEEAHVPDSVERVQLSDDATSKTYCWNRRSRQSVWKPPGIRAVWVGTHNSEAKVYCWHKDTRVSSFDLPPLPPG